MVMIYPKWQATQNGRHL